MNRLGVVVLNVLNDFFLADSIEKHSKEIDERKNMEQDVAAWVPSSVVPKKGQHLFGSLSCFSSLPSF